MFRQAIGLHQRGRLSEAEKFYRDILRFRPDAFEARHYLGVLRSQQGRTDEALALLDAVLAKHSDYAEAHYNRGNILAAVQRYAEALSSYERALAIRPDNAQAHTNRGNALLKLMRFADALAAYERALVLAPFYSEALDGRGNALVALNRAGEAIECFDQALAQRSDSAPTYNNRGNALRRLRMFEAALQDYDRAIALQPRFVEALVNRGIVLSRLRRYQEALASCEEAARIDSGDPDAFAGAAYAALNLCDWNRVEHFAERLPAHIDSPRMAFPPHQLITYYDDPGLQLRCAERYTCDQVPPAQPYTGAPRSHDRIRVAYLSADFREHAIAHLTVELFELHDRARFEIMGISFGHDDGSAMRRRIVAAFEHFHDVRGMGDRQIEELLRTQEVDIAVDLTGYTDNCRPAVLSRRPCPVQVSLLGFAGSMGASFIDYIIADAVTAPFEHAAHFREQIVQLPGSYYPGERNRAIADRVPARVELGLPEHGFVFCCFNANYKIRAPFFDIWMRLLQKVPGSVLWLKQDNPGAVANLKREAQARAVDPARLVFAGRCDMPDHLARHRAADLFLDTLPCNAHTTATDALWAGLPVLTCQGRSFAARVAASVLQAAGLPDMVVHDLDQYEALALRLATTPTLLNAVRERLRTNHDTCALFDSDRYRRNLERAYTTMWEIAERREPPRSFRVDPD
jgi:predicted O-linked N-acetylglucosamine transferase (SPINDLY family)